MSAVRYRRREDVVLPLVLAAVLAGVGPLCRGQTVDEIDPTGGLRSRDTAPPPAAGPTSRDELMRQWDLDFNGTVDPSEAAVARARMRRARKDMEAGAELDPLTGKPRATFVDESDQAEPQPEADPVIDVPAPPRKKSPRDPALPGTRVPVPDPVVRGTALPPAPAGQAPAEGGDSTSRRPWSSLAPTRPGARPGYGTISPKPDLNAGLPKPVLGRGGPGTQGGGLLPTMRLPQSRPLAPPAPRPLPQRVTADDIGGF